MRGRALTFGDDINTDVILPIDTHTNLPNVADAIENLFGPIRPDFHETVREGDVIVAGEHFGCGSGRENTAEAIKTVGISAVVAESFARLFYRNAIAIGLPVVTCPGVTDHVSEGDVVDIDLAGGVVRNVDTGESLPSEPLPVEIRAIFDAGGWSGYLDGGRNTLRRE